VITAVLVDIFRNPRLIDCSGVMLIARIID
jgi:hypothetical protein